MKENYIFVFYLLSIVVSGDTASEWDWIASKINNNSNSGWEAVVNVNLLKQLEMYKNLPVVPRNTTKFLRYRTEHVGSVAEVFDSRAAWPKCVATIARVRNQGDCGSCWAVNAAAVISDRICIGTNGAKVFQASAEDLLSCCPDCPAFPDNICGGGYGARAFQYWKTNGVVSGGEVDSNEGCKPYSRETFKSPKQLPCKTRCTNPNYAKTYSDDKIYAQSAYHYASEKEIMYDIGRNGPAMALVVVYRDLFYYKQGVYQHQQGDKVTNHFVKLIGWGTENGKKFWLCINSWGQQWGMGGYFKILRGINHCNIESEISAAKLNPDIRSRKGVVGEANIFQPSFVHVLIYFCCYIILFIGNDYHTFTL